MTEPQHVLLILVASWAAYGRSKQESGWNARSWTAVSMFMVCVFVVNLFSGWWFV